NPVRNVTRLDIKKRGDCIIIGIEANAFLQHMVRNIAGLLMEVGMGKQAPAWSGSVLKSRDRTLGGSTAAADGLYLARVDYPEQFAIPLPQPEQWPLCL
ncbi:MAG: tRNA pseudouridine(38-40) synthase TruA, partial [Thiotrichales bacterium]|nr:tRNA pseudouridine(38-40) synthase TruA [Thiotrichales bacterium]